MPPPCVVSILIRYTDRRDDFKSNEVATDYNAGFTGALAGLQQMSSGWNTCRARGWGLRSRYNP